MERRGGDCGRPQMALRERPEAGNCNSEQPDGEAGGKRQEMVGWGKGGWGCETKFSLAIGVFLLQVLLRLCHGGARLDVISWQAPGEFAAVPHD